MCVIFWMHSDLFDCLLAQSSNIVSWKIIPCGALNNIERQKRMTI